ncbi:MFS transporter [Nanoarchaeota archaeon]
MQKNLASNIWKYFLYNVSLRRHFIPLLSIYFLTLPNTTAQQIGLFTGIGWIFSFLLEIPSGYISDKFGHKNTLILAKFFMLVSITCFILANSLIWFIFGAIFLSAGFAFHSGTASAFIHNTLVGLKREKDYTKVMGRLAANAALISMVLIIALPFFTTIDILLPFKINFVIDVIGLIIAFTLVSPNQKFEAEVDEPEDFWKLIKKHIGTGFFSTALYFGTIAGILVASTVYRDIYVVSLGYPIFLVGFVMGISRLFWFIFGHLAHIIEKKVSFQKLMVFELLMFPVFFILITVIQNAYVVGFLFSIVIGYFWGRHSIIDHYFIKNLILNKNYKATMISVYGQIKLIYKFVTVFILGIIMGYSFQLGFLFCGISMLVILVALLPAVIKQKVFAK